jgi:hypothetical protein
MDPKPDDIGLGKRLFIGCLGALAPILVNLYVVDLAAAGGGFILRPITGTLHLGMRHRYYGARHTYEHVEWRGHCQQNAE